jgi:hypothetical protein
MVTFERLIPDDFLHAAVFRRRLSDNR